MVRHQVIRIGLGGERRKGMLRTGCISLIGQGFLALQICLTAGASGHSLPFPFHPRHRLQRTPTSLPVLSFILSHTLRSCIYQTPDQLSTSLSMVSPCRPRIRHSGCLCTLQIASRTPCWQIRYPVPRLPRCYE